MHTRIEIFKEGVRYLGITDPEEMFNILNTMKENENYIPEGVLYLQRLEAYKTRGEVPKGLTKKQLQDLKKQTQTEIDERRKHIQEIGNEIGFLSENEIQNILIPKKNKINKLLKFYGVKTEKLDLAKAKEYPIEDLLDFNIIGFAICPFHGPEKTASLKWYPKRNKGHCFGCGVDVDPIDIYQKLNKVTFIEAIKALTK